MRKSTVQNYSTPQIVYKTTLFTKASSLTTWQLRVKMNTTLHYEYYFTVYMIRLQKESGLRVKY